MVCSIISLERGLMEMSKFIENLKKYLENRKIRQTYVSLMTGWDKSRVSKILSGTIDLKESEAEFLAKALGHDMSYFLTDFSDQYKEQAVNGQLAFFAGTLNDEDKKTADKLVEMFRFYDALTMIEI